MMAGRSEFDADRLIEELVRELAPVGVIASPLRRTAFWAMGVCAVALAVAPFGDLSALWARLLAAPDMWLAFVGAILTALLAAYAAFQLNLPDRGPAWALLPAPGLALWLGASGLGCLRDWFIPGLGQIPAHEIAECFLIIAGFSAPLSATMLLMLRRGYCLIPSANAAMGGLAVAAAAAILLQFFHRFDATFLDLLVHFATVGLVVATSRRYGALVLAAPAAAPRRR